MRTLKSISLTIVLLLGIISYAQDTHSCVHCRMDIEDNLHRAQAIIGAETLHFDAIECLINYLRDKNEMDFSAMLVADFTSGELIDAASATYLKSKNIPSPMGAYLSAFKSRTAAVDAQTENTGELFSWNTIKVKFEDSRFGATNHSHHEHFRADAYAPSGIMGDHLHPKGGLMFSFSAMYMGMGGNLDGSDNISDTGIYDRYMVAPQEMNMQMYMLGVMYAPTNRVTLMLMQNFVRKDMDLTGRMMMNGMPMLNDFSTNSTGWGDMQLSALVGGFTRERSSLHFNAAINIPVGSIDNRDDTPMSDDAKLPYAMQLGSGTWDMTLGLTYKLNWDSWTLGPSN